MLRQPRRQRQEWVESGHSKPLTISVYDRYEAGDCSDMFIRKLRPGERASEKTDRICLDRLKSGRISWTGLLDAGRKAVMAASPVDFASVQEAETDAIAWARGHGATELQIEGPSF